MVNRVFLGIGKSEQTFALTVRNDSTKSVKMLPAQHIESDSLHSTILQSILFYLKVAKCNERVIFYASNNLVSSEWENNWKVKHAFAKKTEDVNLWNEIVQIVKSKKIDLTIRGEESVLSALGKLPKR